MKELYTSPEAELQRFAPAENVAAELELPSDPDGEGTP